MAILIVDDSSAQRMYLRGLLRRTVPAEILEADSADACFRILETETDPGVDTILMDVNMPGMDGIEACRRIKTSQQWRDIPVIIVTAEAEAETVEAAFAAGANDYLNKPVNRLQMKARVRAALSLKEARDQRRAREGEIVKIGAMVQQRLLAGQRPTGIAGAAIAVWNQPSRGLDGDFFEFFKHDAHCFDLVVADVMGKGLPAALLGAAVKNHFFRALARLFARQQSPGRPSTDQIVTRVHHEMTGELIRLDAFVTLCYARLDLAALGLELIDAGHPKTILCRAGEGPVRQIEGDNMPLGFSRTERYRHVRVPLFPGDLLFFYSDGLTEATDPDGEMFGGPRLEQCLAQAAGTSPQDVIDAVRQCLTRFTQKAVPHDDMTCIAVRIDPDAAPLARLEITSELRQLSRVRDFINAFCQGPDAPAIAEPIRWQLALGINEAVANIIRHAYQGRTGEPIHIAAMATAQRVRIEIAHQGQPWCPAAIPLPQAAGGSEGGYGLFIMENYIDTVSYDRGRILLEKSLNPEPRWPAPADP